MERFKNYINGEFVEAKSGKWSTVTNPATGEPVYEVPQCEADEVNAAIEAAAASQKMWNRVTIIQRGNMLRVFAKELAASADKLAYILAQEQGKTLVQAKAEINGAASMMEFISGWDRRLEGEILVGNDNNKENIFMFKEPVGVVACIIPWNYPINILVRKIAPALLAGCTVIVKPSSDTPAATLAVAEIMDKIGFPKGVANFVTGRGAVVGNTIAKNPKVNMITVTGSTETGQEILRLSAENICKVSLELGGKAPAVIMADADLELAADCVVNSRLGNAGQICTCVERCYVQEEIADKFVEMLKERFEKATYGDGVKNPNVTMGAMINRKSTERVHAMVERAVAAGAKIVTGGVLPDGPGAFYPPTLLVNVDQKAEIVQEETFGPVLPVLTIKTAEEALEKVNDCQYGLTSSLYTNDYQTIMLFANNVEFGELYVNRKHGGEAYHGFHAGWKKSGIGGDDGKHGFEEFLQTRTVYMDYKTDMY